MNQPPNSFWFEEVRRGKKEVIIVMCGVFPRGSIELESYEEKAAWQKILPELNSTLEQLSKE